MTVRELSAGISSEDTNLNPLALTLGLSNEGVIGSAKAKLLSNETIDLGIEAAIEKPFYSDARWEVIGTLKGTW